MSVFLYEGVPGSGKTYAAVKDAYYHRGPVITNIEITGLENTITVPLEMMTPLIIQNFCNWWWSTHEFRENGILLIIDECQQLFNSREGLSKEDRQERLENVLFTCRSRKFGLKIIYICQQREMLDKQMRNCVESVYNFQIIGSAIPLLKLLPVPISRCNCYLGIESNLRISRELFPIIPKFFKYYDTRQDCVFTDLPYADISYFTDYFKSYAPTRDIQTRGASFRVRQRLEKIIKKSLPERKNVNDVQVFQIPKCGFENPRSIPFLELVGDYDIS